MSNPAPPPRVTLIYGNQPYQVERSATRLVDDVLGDAPRDFAYHRFDAEEMLRGGAAEVKAERLGAFEIACESIPFLCERYLVRLDHLEKVKSSGRAAENVRKALAGLWVVRIERPDGEVWVAEEEAPAGATRGRRTSAATWVREIFPLPGGETELLLAPDPPDFLLAGTPEPARVGLKAFLQHGLKGRIRFAGANPRQDAAAPPAADSGSGAGRLHALLERYLAQPPPGCWLVLTAVAGREADLSSALLKAVKQGGRVEKFVTYEDYQPVDWVIREARARNITLGRPGAAALIGMAGNDLATLAQELDKLALLFSDGARPDEEQLLAALHGNSRHSLFWAAETLGNKNLADTLTVLTQFLAASPQEHPILVGIWARHFRQLYLIHGFRRQGVAENQLAARLKIHPFIAGKLAAQAARFSTGELEGILNALASLDVELKRRATLHGPLLKDFALAVCTGGFGAAPAFARPAKTGRNIR